MTPEELSKVKEYQRDFEERFGKKLHIDWTEMKQLSMDFVKMPLEDVLKYCVQKHGADEEKLKKREKRSNYRDNHAERNALREYSKIVISNSLNVAKAATLINRHHSMIYHFLKFTDVAKTKKPVRSVW